MKTNEYRNFFYSGFGEKWKVRLTYSYSQNGKAHFEVSVYYRGPLEKTYRLITGRHPGWIPGAYDGGEGIISRHDNRLLWNRATCHDLCLLAIEANESTHKGSENYRYERMTK